MTKEQQKHKVWSLMHELIQAIEDGKIDSDKVCDLMSSLQMGISDDASGLQPIDSRYWKTMIEWNESLDRGFDEMVHEGLELFWHEIGGKWRSMTRTGKTVNTKLKWIKALDIVDNDLALEKEIDG